MKTNKKKIPKSGSGSKVIEMTFDGDKVEGVWYDQKIAPVLCALCGKGCKEQSLCYNVNPWCG